MRNTLVFFLLVPLIALIVACEPTPAVQYNLTVTSTEGGSVTTPGEGTFTYEAGTEVELVASPSEGYRFVNWTGDVGTVAAIFGNPTTVTINDHYSITAEFEMSNDTVSEPPPPPEWNPQKQALLPDREFDANWTVVNNWYPALNRAISALWTNWGSVPSMITSPDDGNLSTMLGLSAGHPPGDGPRILRYIFAKNLPGGVPIDLIVRLYDRDTLVEEWVEENIPAAWTTREYELSAEPNTWDDLRVELTRQGDTTTPESDLRQIYVSLVEIEIPYPDNFIFPYLNPATTTHAPGSDTVLRPPGVQEGDLIFVSSFNGEAPEGFNLIYSQPTIDAPQPYHLHTWWKRAGSDEPESYTFPNAEGLWAARISGADDSQITAAGHVEPPDAGLPLPLGILTPSVDAPSENSLVIRISANSGYITSTDPHQWVAWEDWPCPAASWRFQKEAGPTGEEYHDTGSFINSVAQTIVFGPE